MVIYRLTTPPSAGAANGHDGHANGGGVGTTGRPCPDLNAHVQVSEMNMRVNLILPLSSSSIIKLIKGRQSGSACPCYRLILMAFFRVRIPA